MAGKGGDFMAPTIEGTVATISRHAPSVSHLLFADDNLLFGKASVKDNRRVQEILEVYAENSSQRINHEKTSISFSKNVRRGTHE